MSGETSTSALDILRGTSGDDNIRAGDGDDTIFGRRGNDSIFGENGHDKINAGPGNDFVIAGRGNDTVLGGSGEDVIYGKKGNNYLNGGRDDDYINSGDQTSTLVGGDGEDTLEMRLNKGGDHTATGGSGADEFVFSFLTTKAQSDVTITDFELGVDEFSVMGEDAASYLETLSTEPGTDVVSEEKGHAVLTLHSGDTVTFRGITEAEFEDFFGL